MGSRGCGVGAWSAHGVFALAGAAGAVGFVSAGSCCWVAPMLLPDRSFFLEDASASAAARASSGVGSSGAMVLFLPRPSPLRWLIREMLSTSVVLVVLPVVFVEVLVTVGVGVGVLSGSEEPHPNLFPP